MKSQLHSIEYSVCSNCSSEIKMESPPAGCMYFSCWEWDSANIPSSCCPSIWLWYIHVLTGHKGSWCQILQRCLWLVIILLGLCYLVLIVQLFQYHPSNNELDCWVSKVLMYLAINNCRSPNCSCFGCCRPQIRHHLIPIHTLCFYMEMSV